MTDQRSLPRASGGTRGPATHLPGDGHMWVMVLGDLVIFGCYFVAYMVFRAMAPGSSWQPSNTSTSRSASSTPSC